MTIMRVVLGDVVLHDLAPGRNPHGPGWMVQKMKGWYSLSGSKTGFDERPRGHGSFAPGQDWRQSSAISMEGRYRAADHDLADLLGKRDALNAVGGQGHLVPLTVTDDQRTTTRLVSVRNVDADDDHAFARFGFAIDCLAPDPRRYGPAQDVFKELPATQGGNLADNPSAEVDLFHWSAALDGAPIAPTRQAGGFRGGHAARVTALAAVDSVVLKNLVPLAMPVPAHTVSIRAQASSPRLARLTCTWRSSVEVFQTATTAPVLIGTGWTPLTLAKVPFPAGATQLYVAVDSTGLDPWAAGDWLAADGVMVGVTPDYHDGNDDGWSWAGTPGKSKSLDSEQIELVNDGTADTEPSFTLIGGMPEGFSIIEVETGRQVRFGKPIPADATTIVDPAEGVVLVNGVPQFGLTRYQWPLVPAGTARHYLVTQPTRVPITVDVRFAPAWW